MISGLPNPSIRLLVDQVAVMALSALGRIPNPVLGRVQVSPERARFNLGLLEVLEEKTSGNLTDEERRHLEARIEELRDALDELGQDED